MSYLSPRLDISSNANVLWILQFASSVSDCSRPDHDSDEVNCNVYETLAFNDVSRHEDNPWAIPWRKVP